MIVWVIAGLLGMATGLRIGWALVNKQSVVSSAMIVALGSLAVVAALNWPPLTLLLDTSVGWSNISIGLSQVALIGCAAGSCVMITSVASSRSPAAVHRIAAAQYAVATVIAVITLVLFFSAGQQPEMSPEEYLKRNLESGNTSLPWLLPLLYLLLAFTLVLWAGMRHSNRTRRGRALFVFTLGIALIVAASAFFLIRAVGTSRLVGVGTAATLLGAAMAIVAAGSLLPAIEDWFGGRRELRLIDPLLTELERRQPDVGIGERPRGPLVFRVAERLSLISDALYLEATVAQQRQQRAGTADGAAIEVLTDVERATISPVEQATAIAKWIYAGRRTPRVAGPAGQGQFPGMDWLRQPENCSDREWILEIARQYRGARAGETHYRGPLKRTRRCRSCRYSSDRLIVEVFLAAELIDLGHDVLLSLRGQPYRARGNASYALVAHIGQPGEFLVELLVVLIVGEVRRFDPEEVGKRRHGGRRRIRPVA